LNLLLEKPGRPLEFFSDVWWKMSGTLTLETLVFGFFDSDCGSSMDIRGRLVVDSFRLFGVALPLSSAAFAGDFCKQ
jgi:hypothetical protein